MEYTLSQTLSYSYEALLRADYVIGTRGVYEL